MMRTKIRELDYGIRDLLVEASKNEKRIGIVKVTSASDASGVEKLVDSLERLFPPGMKGEVYTYIPPEPENEKTIRNGKLLLKQDEEIPLIKELDNYYVIVSNRVDTGDTLLRAMEILIRQEVEMRKIWLLTQLYRDQEGPFLDRAYGFL